MAVTYRPEIVVVSVEVDTRPARPADRARRAVLVEAIRGAGTVARVYRAATSPEIRQATARGTKAGIVALIAGTIALTAWWLANLAATTLTVAGLTAGTPAVLWAAVRTWHIRPVAPTRRDKPVKVTARAHNLPAIEGRKAITQ